MEGLDRFALWIPDEAKADALRVPEISQRISRVQEFREGRDRKETQKLAQTPWRFGFRSYSPEPFILVPKSSSERRDYLPIGMMDSDTLISDLAFAVYGAELWLFSLITSRMHMAWARSVGGKFKEDPRYSNTLVYNTFPMLPVSNGMKEELTTAALRVLDVREYHCEKTLAVLYDPDKMPDDLRAAHKTVDDLVDSIYSKRPYETDEERLSDLFALYEKKSAEEETKNPKKKRRK
nr:type IIL restriction-modification enzyme MmeI [Brevibacterium sp. 'Marine']